MPSTPDSPTTPLGAALRTGREHAGLSIRQAAGLAKFSPTTWTALETGTRTKAGAQVPVGRPAAGLVIAAARVIGLDAEDALTLAGYDPRHWIAPEGQADMAAVDEQVVVDRISLLTGEQLAAVNAVVHVMLAKRPTADLDEEGAA